MARRNKYLPPEDNQLYAENMALAEATYRLYDMINHHIGVNFPSGTMEGYAISCYDKARDTEATKQYAKRIDELEKLLESLYRERRLLPSHVAEKVRELYFQTKDA